MSLRNNNLVSTLFHPPHHLSLVWLQTWKSTRHLVSKCAVPTPPRSSTRITPWLPPWWRNLPLRRTSPASPFGEFYYFCCGVFCVANGNFFIVSERRNLGWWEGWSLSDGGRRRWRTGKYFWFYFCCSNACCSLVFLHDSR